MDVTRAVGAILVAAAIIAGTIDDRPQPPHDIRIDGYRVLAGDLHNHTSLWSTALLSPLGVVLEARRHGLDVIAVTGHNSMASGRVARWFARRFAGPIVLAGEEVQAPRFHVVVAATTQRISFRLPAATVIREAHRQGGIAIAAHPTGNGTGYDGAALRELDGTEVCHPVIYRRSTGQNELEAFAAKTNAAPIGSTDFHGFGPMGVCRTWIFASEASERGVIDAIRARRTVVYGVNGKVYGEPRWVRDAAACNLASLSTVPNDSALSWVSRIAGLMGFVMLLTRMKTW